MLARLTAFALVALLTLVIAVYPSAPTAQAGFTLVGLVDGGKPSGRSLSPNGTLTIVSDDSGAPARYTVSLAWVQDQLPEISQDDLLSIEVEVLPDGTLVATSVTNQSERQGTENDGLSTGSRVAREQPRQPSVSDKSNEGPPTPTVTATGVATGATPTASATATPLPMVTSTPTPILSNVIPTLDTVDDVGLYTSLRLNASGFPVVSYYDQTNNDLKLIVCGNTTCSSGNTIRTLDSTGFVGAYTSLQLNASGFPVISYYDTTNSGLKLIVCGDTTCSAGNTIRTIDSGGVLAFTSLQLNASGNPVVSYSDQTNGRLKLIVCGDATCSAGNTIRTLDTGLFGTPSLRLNASGFPVVSYLDNTNRDLKIIICGDASCSAGNTIRTLDSTGDVGFFSSLQLNGSGFPVVSYYDQTNGDLKLIACGDATCSAGNTIRSLDTTGFVGEYTSLQLNSSGFPVISYYDDINGDLKIVVCGNATCTP